MQSDTGKQLGNRYQRLEELGRGGMGVVLKCTDLVLTRTVALKLLDCINRDDHIARFQTEAKAAARLDHPGIVNVLDFGIFDDGRLFLSMDYVEGESLQELILSKWSPTLETCVFIFKQIADGLQHAHEKGVLHRDVKPSNVMIGKGRDLEVKIVDFGVAKLADDGEQNITRTGVAIGSPGYMSPEAAKGERVDTRSDIYSFGCLMFEVLTGERPFSGGTSLETMMMHIDTEAPSLAEKADLDFPDQLEEIVRICLQKSPDQRFQSFSQIRQALEDIKDGQESSMTSEPDTSSGLKPLLYTVLGCLLLALAVTTIVSSIMRPGEIVEIEQPDVAPVFDANVKTEHSELKLIKALDKAKPKLVAQKRMGAFVLSGDLKGDLEFVRERHDVRDLTIRMADLRNGVAAPLSSLPLESLDITACDVDESTMRCVGQITTLAMLNMSNCNGVTENVVRQIAKFENLNALDLKNTGITDYDIEQLTNSRRLQKLVVKQCPNLTARSWTSIASLSGLKHLVSNNSNIESTDNAGSIRLPASLRRLQTSILNQELIKQANKCKLETFVLVGNRQITDKDLDMLASLRTVKNATIYKCPGVTRRAVALLDRKMKGCNVKLLSDFL